MAQLCFCFSDAPPDRSKPPRNEREAAMFKFYDNNIAFQINLCDAVTQGQPCCCIGALPCTFPCVQYQMRVNALTQVGNGMADYTCGQGYCRFCCFQPGRMGEKSCPELCLCCEACCCPGLVVSATRAVVMDRYQLMPDPCDTKIMHFNNCMQMLACICTILSMIDDSFRELAMIIDCIADVVFFSVAGCMTAQVDHELKYQKTNMQGVQMGNVVEPSGFKGAPAHGEAMER